MIDTIHIRINTKTDLTQGPNYIERLVNAIIIEEEGVKHATGKKFFAGRFRNFIIEIDGDNVAIKGSLAKYYQGNNLEWFDRSAILLALKQLSLDLGLNVERGRISRIDVSDNLFLTQPPVDYSNLLIGIPKANKTNIKNTLYFKRSCISAIYDKAKELYRNDIHTYNKLKKAGQGTNVFRFEVRFEKKLAKLFDLKVVKVAHLHSTTFLTKLARLWLKQYLAIEKLKQEFEPKITQISQFKKMLMFKGITEFGGVQSACNMVDMLKYENDWPYKSAYDLKVLIKSIANSKFLVGESPLIKELDEAVENSNIVKTFIKKCSG